MTRARVLAILDGEDPALGRSVAFAINALIVITAVAVALETVDRFQACCGWVFVGVELLAVVVFGTDYALRVWARPDRLGYVLSLGGIVDLLSFLPTMLLVLGSGWGALRTLRLVRLIRLFGSCA